MQSTKHRRDPPALWHLLRSGNALCSHTWCGRLRGHALGRDSQGKGSEFKGNFKGRWGKRGPNEWWAAHATSRSQLQEVSAKWWLSLSRSSLLWHSKPRRSRTPGSAACKKLQPWSSWSQWGRSASEMLIKAICGANVAKAHTDASNAKCHRDLDQQAHVPTTGRQL